MLEELDLLGPSIVHYLGAFDLCFLPVFFRLGLFLVLFLHHDGPIIHLINENTSTITITITSRPKFITRRDTAKGPH